MSAKTRFFKYHKDRNEEDGRPFSAWLFKFQPVILLKVPPKSAPRIFYVFDQNKGENWQDVESMPMIGGRGVPKKAEEITRERFEEMAGSA